MLHIHLFGAMRLALDGAPYPLGGLPKTKLVLAYLLLNRTAPVSRDILAFTLWSDVAEQDARANLRRHLYDLQQVLPAAPAETPWILRTQKTLQWNPRASYWLDVAVFEELEGNPEQLAEAVGLYTGELLAHEDEDWLGYERGRLRAVFLRKLQELVHAYQARGDYMRALMFVQQALVDDPLDEQMVRTYMWLRYATGDRAGALQAYRQFCQQLQAELDLVPMPETEELARQISSQTLPVPKEPDAAPLVRPARTQQAAPQATPPPSNVPAPLRRILGRADELQSFLALFGQQGEPLRLMTLTGAGGVGKTRLAIELARLLHLQQPQRFPDGVFFVPLASVTDPDLFLPTVAVATGLTLHADAPVIDQLIDDLRYKTLLLVLDNFEHLLAAADQLAALLAAVPGLHTIVTSQTVLNLYGERSFQVMPLTLPAAGQEGVHESLLAQPAVALFCEVAQSVNAQFRLTEANEDAVVQICRRLDGLPLAIELAAAWAKLLSPAQILQQLSSELDFLATKLRDIPSRHRSLRTAMAWSYQLLDADEQSLFAQLSLFADSFTSDAVAALLNGAVEERAPAANLRLLAHLNSLLEKNMIYPVIHDSLPGETRFAMLNPLRSYAGERLAEQPDLAPLHSRYVAYFKHFVDETIAQYEATQNAHYIQQLIVEDNNLRAALSLALAPDAPFARYEMGAQMASRLSAFWEATARFGEAMSWLTQLAEKRALLPLSQRVALLNETCRFLRYGSDLPADILRLHGEALEAAHEAQDARLLMDTLDSYAITCNESGQFDQAIAYWTEAIEIARSEALLARLAHLLNNAATSYTMMGQYAQSVVLLQESLALARTLANPDRTLSTLINLSNAARKSGDLQMDRAYLEEAAEQVDNSSNRTLQIVFLSAAAERALYIEDYPMSALLHSALQSICQQVNMVWPIRYRQEFAGYMAQTMAHLDEVLYTRLCNQGMRLKLDQALERTAIWLEEGR